MDKKYYWVLIWDSEEDIFTEDVLEEHPLNHRKKVNDFMKSDNCMIWNLKEITEEEYKMFK